ncbi:MAG: hypothetical protein A4E59_00885 [Syntrophorhabdus sp. PtaB.Bin027]|jgi:uncharacterized protein YgfB (UPF0149 family)|nr:MAG: hypothetical protein A4E59_00885 [Syntrophorhabdus sp. PtaB.Bin027]OQB77026.1 MAG: hypothetical protein BWX92_01239 [Deltaproteobacteria bacterium ADurb.Bin135]
MSIQLSSFEIHGFFRGIISTQLQKNWLDMYIIYAINNI